MCPTALPFDTALCLFRVAQEALRNAGSRHARASAVMVFLCRRGTAVCSLPCATTAAAFDPASHRPGEQPRHPAEHARAGAADGGELDIESTPGHGTEVVHGFRRERDGRPRVLLADDHRMVAEGLKSVLEEEFDLVGIVEDGRAMVKAARELKPDVIVADISMPLLNGIDALAQLKGYDPDVRVVLLTMHRDPAYARRALQLGALGFVLKHSAPAELLLAVRARAAGPTFIAPDLAAEVFRTAADKGADPVGALTPRQREIVNCSPRASRPSRSPRR